MRLLIDASSLLLRSAGIKSYTYHWLAAMRDIAGADRVDAFPFIGRLGALALRNNTDRHGPWLRFTIKP